MWCKYFGIRITTKTLQTKYIHHNVKIHFVSMNLFLIIFLNELYMQPTNISISDTIFFQTFLLATHTAW